MAIKKESLIASTNRIEAPFIRIEINGYTFGVYEEKQRGIGPNGMWKNIKDDVIGLCHYRRFFINNGNYLKLQDAKEILKNNDIIITNNVQFERGIYEQLRLEMPNDEERLILDKYYNELCDKIPGLKEYFDTKEFAPKEMFVCKQRVMNKYCKWLFNIIIPSFGREDIKE